MLAGLLIAAATIGAGCAAKPVAPFPDLAADWPRVLDVEGCRVAFADEGRCRPADTPWLLVHGLGGNKEEFSALRRLAAKDHSVLSLDLPGFGLSSNPALDYRISRYAQLLDAFLTRAELQRVHLVCHSMGGQICLAFAAEHSARVASLTLIDSAGTYERGEYVRWALSQGINLNVGVVETQRHPAIELVTGGNQKILGRLVGDNPTLLAALQSFGSNLRERVRYLSVPVQIIWGTDDPVFSVDNAFYLKENIPGSELHLVEGAGHLPFASHPELVFRWVDEFHQRVGVAGSVPGSLAEPAARPSPPEDRQ